MISTQLFSILNYYTTIQFHDAAKVDGANAWQIFWMIAVPLSLDGLEAMQRLRAIRNPLEKKIELTKALGIPERIVTPAGEAFRFASLKPRKEVSGGNHGYLVSS
jgi:hypothetical protein